MMRHVWSVLCSKTSIDRASNNVSLFEVLESIQLQTPNALTFPANIPFEATFITLWARQDPTQPLRAQMQVRLLAPDGNELGEFHANIDLETAPRSRQLTALRGLRISGNGNHDFEVSWRHTDAERWQVVARVPLEVSVTVEAQAPTATQG